MLLPTGKKDNAYGFDLQILMHCVGVVAVSQCCCGVSVVRRWRFSDAVLAILK